MPEASCSDADFMDMFEAFGPAHVSRTIGISMRSVYKRRVAIENRYGRQLTAPRTSPNATRHNVAHPGRINMEVDNGVVLVGSDHHYWPGIITTAHRAFLRACRELKPVAVIANGDVLDGATISRHPPIGWESRPSLVDEVETCKERLAEIEKEAKGARRIWSLGNHDGRFETRLATVAPEYARLHGVHLKDHFPAWEPCWSVWINDDVVIKHRYKGGIHATHNNTLSSGKTMVTGHLHSLKVTPYSDYAGTRFGVDTGTMADPWGPQFSDYLEDNPVNWRSGFVVLTFQNGRLLWPEIVHVLDGQSVEFRGKVWTV